MNALLLASCWAVALAEGPALRVAGDGKTVEATGLAAADLEALAKRPPDDAAWPKLFAVYVDKSDPKDRLALLGAYRVEKDRLVFEPRFPLARGVRYRAVLDPSRLPSHKGGKAEPIEAALFLEKPKTPPTAVAQVYPTADKLPENQLKFYLHFSAPMSRGEAYQRVRLLNEDGKAIAGAFLEIDEELWDRDGKRLTLFIDPGRIKRGLKPREDLGPVLEEGKRYTLEIDRRFSDAEGEPLKETYRKTFRAGPAEEKMPDVKTWKVQAPEAGGRGELMVTFPRPMEHALAVRMIWVVDGAGNRLAGSVQATDEETRWRFTPEKAWAAGAYKLTADARLEDLAGNSLARAFEVDVFGPVERELKVETVTLPFEVKARR